MNGAMDSGRSGKNAHPDERVDSLINEYFDRRQAGEELTPEGFAAEHPDLAEDLLPYLDGLAFLERVHPAAGGAADSPAAEAGAADLPVFAGFELLEEIGRGGMGVVYRALQVSTKRVVALKVVSAGPFASQSALRRFDREVELAARLQHSGIVRVLESGRVGQQQYFAMDYVDGVRLDDYLPAEQRDVRDVLRLCVQLCEATDYAHGRGVVHRDLKPANVLIDEEGRPRILDFGLAKATDQPETDEAFTITLSLPGQVLGTLHYLSPEQASGKPSEIDGRTDVYALGVIMFEALTGSLPYDTSGRPSDVIQRILEAPPTQPSSLSKRVNTELETIVLKALHKEKERRYQSAREMADDIRRYLEGEPILAKRPSSFYFLRKKLLKHRRVAAAVAATVVVVILAGLVAGVRSRQRELARARRVAVDILSSLEIEDPHIWIRTAVALSWKHPRLPEAFLVARQAEYRSGEQPRAVLGLERKRRATSEWAYSALLEEIYRVAGNTDWADTLRTQVEQEAPDTADAWFLRSFATLDLERAAACAKEALRRQPAHALAWRRLTYLRRSLNDSLGALQGADKLIELGEDPAPWILFKGHVLYRLGRYEEAIEQYSLIDAFECRGHVYRRLEKYGEAEADYTAQIGVYGEARTILWIFYQRATPRWILGRPEGAIEDYRRFRTIWGRPSFADARHYLILRELGRQSEAQKVLSAALRDAHDPWLGQVFRCLAGRLSPADLVAEGASSGDMERLCEAYYYAGEVYLLSNQRAEARKWFEKCVNTGLRFDPDIAITTPTPMNEFELAQWRLRTVVAGAPASAP